MRAGPSAPEHAADWMQQVTFTNISVRHTEFLFYGMLDVVFFIVCVRVDVVWSCLSSGTDLRLQKYHPTHTHIHSLPHKHTHSLTYSHTHVVFGSVSTSTHEK